MFEKLRGFALGGILALLAAVPAASQGIAGADNRIVFGYRTDAPPFSFEVVGDVLAFSGFTAEICKRVAREPAALPEGAGLERATVRVTAEDRFERLEAGEIDVLCGAASVTPERRERVEFSIPVLKTGIAVSVAEDAPDWLRALTAARDLDRALAEILSDVELRIGYRLGTTTEDWLEEHEPASEAGVTLQGFPDHRAGIAALTAGEVDIYMGDHAILRGLQRTMSPGIDIADEMLQDETIALAIGRGADKLQMLINAVLADLYRTGEIVPIFERHFGPTTEADRAFYARLAELAR